MPILVKGAVEDVAMAPVAADDEGEMVMVVMGEGVATTVEPPPSLLLAAAAVWWLLLGGIFEECAAAGTFEVLRGVVGLIIGDLPIAISRLVVRGDGVGEEMAGGM